MVLFVIYFGRSHISTVYGNNGPRVGFTTVDLVAIKDLTALRKGVGELKVPACALALGEYKSLGMVTLE